LEKERRQAKQSRKEGEEPTMKKQLGVVYEAPKVITFGSSELFSHLGPSLSCTGFGGSTASGC